MPDLNVSEQLTEVLPDAFAKVLLDGSLRVASDTENQVRGNLFAAGMRELLTYCLHLFAPDDDVRETPWFEQAEDTNGVTRRQRIRYATQRGLSDDFMKSAGIDIAELQNALHDAFKALNQATHVRPGRTIHANEDVQDIVSKTSAALEDFLRTYESNREQLREKLASDVYRAIMGEFIERTFYTIDIIAGTGYEVDPMLTLEEVIIEDLTATDISIRVFGEAPVTLHYSRGDDGANIRHDFAFWMQFTASAEAPRDLSLVDYHVDNSSWFEGGNGA